MEDTIGNFDFILKGVIIFIQDQVTLMADPHYVDGSQDRFTFRCPSTLSNAPLVEELEFVLQQPSPHWHKFGKTCSLLTLLVERHLLTGLNKLKCFTTDLEPGKVTKKEVIILFNITHLLNFGFYLRMISSIEHAR